MANKRESLETCVSKGWRGMVMNLRKDLSRAAYWFFIILFALLAAFFEIGCFHHLNEAADLAMALSDKQAHMRCNIAFFERSVSAMGAQLVEMEAGMSNSWNGEKLRIVSRVNQLQPRLDALIGARIVDAVFKSCGLYSLSPGLVINLMFRESSFNHMSISKKGAVGLMQVHPPSHPEKVEGIPISELYGIETNIELGCRILREYLDSSTSLREALGKYLGKRHRKSDIQAVLSLLAEYESLRWEGRINGFLKMEGE